jgi:DNA repair protein RecN (Recombination protein N)
MNALGLLLGARASPELIRRGKKEAVIEALFQLDGDRLSPELVETLELQDGDQLSIRRIVGDQGRSRVLVNDSLSTVQALGRVAPNFVQIYGQHEQQSLLRIDSHIAILDRYADLEKDLEQYRVQYRLARELREKLDELNRRERQRESLLELARFQSMELEKAALVPGEDEELAVSRTILANSAKITTAVEHAEELLYGVDEAAIDSIARAQTRLTEAAVLDSRLKETLDLIGSARATLEEAAHQLRIHAQKIEADPARLEQIEDRLQELSRLKRKYGGTVATALEALEKARGEITSLEAVAETRIETETALTRVLEDLKKSASSLSSSRRQVALELKKKMEVELKSLGMRNGVFEVHFEKLTDADALNLDGISLGSNGCDEAEFFISPNLGQPPMALARFASGGELSRLMLALKRLEAQRRGVATMIFDEVDAGIGGAIAEVVGRKLKELSKFHQVLCITHLPQIAAFADKHFVVEKEERRGDTVSRVTELDKSSRVDELARMMGGADITEKIRRAARELLDAARV